MKNFDLNDYYYEDYFDYDQDDVLYTDSQEQDSIKTCIIPSIQQVSSYIFVLLFACIICRLLWVICGRLLQHGHWLKHLISLVCGIAVLYATIGQNVYIILLLTLSAYGVIRLISHLKIINAGAIVIVVVIAINITFEFVIASSEIWNSLRGVQMVIAMKVISIAFDMEAKENKEKYPITNCPRLVPYMGFIFCPASCTVGPWIPYNLYVSALKNPKIKFTNTIIWTVSNTILAVMSLCVSNCLAPLLCTNRSWIWLQAYRDALTVRSSHYFISFLSQATLAANGMSWDPDVKSNILMGNIVTKPWRIEFPRSISSVIRNWNLPMHTWLKNYIFHKSKKQFNNYLIAIFITYLISSLLHGLYFQVHVVLLTLGGLAYVENMLRNKLANIFDACIAAAPCRKPCLYTYCNNQPKWWLSSSAWCVTIFNVFFSFISILNLAYLGVMLNTRDEGQSSFHVGLERWHQLGFLSHWNVLVTFIFDSLI